MAIALRGIPTRTRVIEATTSWVVDLPTGVAAGDVVEIVTTTIGNHTISAFPTGTQPTKHFSSFTSNGDGSWDADGDPTARIFLYTVPSSPPPSVTVTMAGAVAGYAYATAFSGVDNTDASSVFLSANQSSSGGAVVRSPAITTTVAESYVTRGVLVNSGGAIAPPPGTVASASNITNVAPSSCVAAMGVKASTGTTGDETFTNAGVTSFGSGWTHALAPGSGGGGGTPPAGGAVAFGSKTTRLSGDSTTDINKPAGTVAGDLLLLHVENGGALAVNTPAGWTLVNSKDSIGDYVTTALYYKIAGGSEPSSYTVTFSGGETSVIQLLRYTGVDASNPLSSPGLVFSGAQSTASPTPAAASGAAGSVVVELFAWEKNSGAQEPGVSMALPGTPWVTRSVEANGIGYVNIVAAVERAGPGSTPVGATTAYPGWWAVHTVVINPGEVAAGNTAPTVNAGSDQTDVEPFATVTLAATASDPDGTVTSVVWTQLSGTTVTLGGTGSTRTFEAPGTLAGETLTFRATATDNSDAAASDDVSIVVLPATEFGYVAGVLTAVQMVASG